MTTPSEPELPERSERVVVSISHPETAPRLIDLAKAFTAPGGTVSVLSVLIGDADAETGADQLEELEAMVASAGNDTDIELRFDARTAPSISRGILDHTRERNADLVILGVDRNAPKGELSSVNEAVLATAHCGVIAFRPGPRRFRNAERIVVGVNGSEACRTAVSSAISLGAALDVPVHAVHVKDRSYSSVFARAAIERSLEGVPGAESVRREVVDGIDSGHGLVARLRETDVLVIGSSMPSPFERFVSTNTAAVVLRTSKVPVMLVSRSGDREHGVSRVVSRLRSMRPQLTRLERDTMVWRADSAALLTTDFVMLLAVSALLASFGLLQNSVAVVIGAMLVAPLLGPLAAVSIGLVTARLGLTGRAAITLVAGTVATLVVSASVGTLVPIDAPTSEMLARGSPSLVDFGVALAAAVVGAYATARKDIPAALAGVAIAAALVPPLCTTGLALAFRNTDLAIGSFVLYVTNIVSIAVVGVAVLWWMGVRPPRGDIRLRPAWITAVIFTLLSLVPVVAVIRGLEGAREARLATEDLRDLFPEGEVVDVFSRATDPVTVVATVRSVSPVSPQDVAAVEAALERRVGRDVTLEVVIEQVVRGAGEDATVRDG